jgi:hypothetical protein
VQPAARPPRLPLQGEPIAGLVAAHFKFSDTAVRVAKKAVRRIGLYTGGGAGGGGGGGGAAAAAGDGSSGGSVDYNGLHLQLEAHPDDWSVFLGNDDSLVALFLKVRRRLGLGLGLQLRLQPAAVAALAAAWPPQPAAR